MVCIDDEIPFEIPQGWEWCRISHLFLHTSGKQQSYTNKDKGIPQRFITTSNLYWGRFVLDNLKVMNFTKEETETCSATKGDLLVCEGGAGYGRSAIWDKDYDICLQNHIHRLRPYIDGICEYIYYFIYFLKESNQLASVGTAMPGLSANRLKRLLLPLPPYKEQKYIVDKLTTILSLVDSYGDKEKILSQLNVNLPIRLRKSILQEAIQGKLVPQDPNDEPASVLLQRIREEKLRLVKAGKLKKKDVVDSIIYKGNDNKYYEQIGKEVIDITKDIPFIIPDSWVWCRMGAIGIWGAGSTPSKGNPNYYGGNVLWLRTGELNNSVVYDTEIKITQKALEECSLRINKVGDVLIAMYGATIGKVAIVGKEMTTNQACCACTPIGVFNRYLFYFLMASQQYFIKIGEGGAQLNISREKLISYLIPIPPIAEQTRIVETLKTLFNKIKDA